MGDADDLFKQNERGKPVWVETVVSPHNFKKGLMKLCSLKPGKHMVYDPIAERFIEHFKKAA